VTTINRNPYLVGQIALSEGLLTPDRLDECIRIQGSDAHGRALGEILVEKGYLTPDEMERVIGIQRTRFGRVSADPERGGLFGQIALRLGYLTREQLSECLREQQQAGEQSGSSLMLGQILVRKNYLSSDRFLEILRRQKKEVARCSGCGAFYDVHDRPAGAKFVCSKCNAVIP
jgi:hypothetical protein